MDSLDREDAGAEAGCSGRALRGSWWPARRHDDKYDAVITFEEWEAVLTERWGCE
jgi:hypothetical protein